MRCRGTRSRLSAYLDGDLSARELRAVAGHLARCAACAERWRSLRSALDVLADAPRLECREGIAARVLDRLEVESRGPGLALLFRPVWAARPLMLPSLLPAAVVLCALLAVAFVLDRGPRGVPEGRLRAEAWDTGLPPSGTEGNPLIPSSGVSAPRARAQGLLPDRLLEEMGEGTLFLETVVARDGSVSAVTLLGGDSDQARPLLEALRRTRFEPGRFHGRSVAVCVYRLISRMDVWGRET